MKSNPQDVEKKRYWQQTIREATRSKLSIREFCRQHRVKESQFYWWQRRLNGSRRSQGLRGQSNNGKTASFALVSNDPGAADAGIELILQDGSRLRISRVSMNRHCGPCSPQWDRQDAELSGCN
jgi:transposase-like protein